MIDGQLVYCEVAQAWVPYCGCGPHGSAPSISTTSMETGRITRRS